MLCQFLLHNSVSQPCVYIHLLSQVSLPLLHPTPLGHERTRLSSLCYTAASHQLSILHVVVYMSEAHQAPPSLGFSRQEHWSGLPLPSLEYICQSYSLSSSHLFLHHVYKSVFYVCVSILLIYCPANKVISTISLDSAYIR